MATSKSTLIDRLNRWSPIAKAVSIGNLLADLVTTVNNLVTDVTALRAAQSAIVTKLNADAGVTDTNYAAAAAVTAVAVTDIDAR